MARTSHADRPTSNRPLPVADLDHLLATATIVLAVLGGLSLLLGATTVGTLLGAAGMATGLVAQMMSRTRSERWVDMIGLLGAFLVLAIGAAQGGLG